MMTMRLLFEMLFYQRNDGDCPTSVRGVFQCGIQQFRLVIERRQRYNQLVGRVFVQNRFDITRSVIISKLLFQFSDARFFTHSPTILSQTVDKVDNRAFKELSHVRVAI